MQTQTVNAATPARATKPASKPLAEPKANPLADIAATRTEPTVKLKALLAEFKLPSDGKLARRFLRKAKFGWHTHAERWEFTASQATDVRAVLAKLAKQS